MMMMMVMAVLSDRSEWSLCSDRLRAEEPLSGRSTFNVMPTTVLLSLAVYHCRQYNYRQLAQLPQGYRAMLTDYLDIYLSE